MSDLSSISNAARGLAKNPLGIIALFIVLIYGFAALTLGFNSNLVSEERLPLVWFLVIFPVIVLGLFGWLVSCHNEKLYAPSDYRSDESFWRKKVQVERQVAEASAITATVKSSAVQAVRELQVAANVSDSDFDLIAEKLSQKIDEATSIKVDATAFTNNPAAIFSYPISAFEALSDLTNAIYFEIAPAVRAYHYGDSWILRDRSSGKVIKNRRMLVGAPPGKPLDDSRPLSEVGIVPGSYLVVEPVHTSDAH